MSKTPIVFIKYLFYILGNKHLYPSHLLNVLLLYVYNTFDLRYLLINIANWVKRLKQIGQESLAITWNQHCLFLPPYCPLYFSFIRAIYHNHNPTVYTKEILN